MQAMKHSLIALAVAAVSSQLALADNQADAKGFIEGASAQIHLRNAYWNRDNKDFNDVSGAREHRPDNKAWAQGFRGFFESGFTQGPVGVGVDAFAFLGVKLDGGAGTAGDRNMSGFLSAKGRLNSDGVQPPANDWSRVGGAVKVRFSGTVLKYGEQMVDTPVFSYDDTRILPQTFTGTLLTSNEIDGLTVHAGHFTAISGMAYAGNDRNSDDVNSSGLNQGTSSTVILGARYDVSENLGFALYLSDVDDVYKKQYVGANYSIPLADEQSLGFDFNLYRTRYDKHYAFGTKFGGAGIDGTNKAKTNNIGSLQVNFETGAHNFILAFQKSSDYGFNYDMGDGGGSIYLSNSFFSDYNSPNEKSYQVGYALDGAGIGIEGLSFRTAYIYGTGADYTGITGKGKESEIFNRVAYTFSNGSAKGLSVSLRNSQYRANTVQNTQYTNDVSDWRFTVEYPLDLTF